VTTQLASETHGDGERVVVFSHGFTQTRAMWRPVAREMCRRDAGLRCVLVDLPGHGESSHVSAGFEEAARLLVQCGGPAVYVGYSLGARLTLRALIDHALLVRGAVSVSGTAGLENESEREARVVADEHLAKHLESVGVAAFLDEWLDQPLFAELTREQAGMSDRLRNTAEGLAMSLRNCGQGRQLPLWQGLQTIPQPLLAIAGALDTKYATLARRLATTAPHGVLALVEGAGHSTPQERPQEVVDAIIDWLPRAV